MTQNVAPGIAGTIDAPSRLELFWERNKGLVYAGLIAAVLAMGVYYGWKYKADRDRSEAWTALAVAAKLDEGYAKPNKSWDSTFKGMIAQNQQFAAYYYFQAKASLVSDLIDQVKGSDDAKLKTLADGSDARAPLALWTIANRALAAADFDAASSRLSDLQKRFPDHFLCKESSYPVQWRPEIKAPEEEKPATTTKPKKAEYEPAKAGSLVAMKIEQVAAEREFRAAHPEFYTAPEPDSAETLVFEFEGAGVVKIKLFKTRAPKHAERLLALAREGGGFWLGQRVHRVERSVDAASASASSPSHFAFGLASTKEDDRTKWKEDAEIDAANLVEAEDSGVSHFPGMVSVEAGKDGKSQVERIVINLDDEAASADGNRVVIGKVVEGMDTVREIVSAEFADDAAAKSGRGRPLDGFKITAVRVE